MIPYPYTQRAQNPAIERCVAAGIVKQTKAQKRNRAFEVPEVIHEFNIFERRLACVHHAWDAAVSSLN